MRLHILEGVTSIHERVFSLESFCKYPGCILGFLLQLLLLSKAVINVYQLTKRLWKSGNEEQTLWREVIVGKYAQNDQRC